MNRLLLITPLLTAMALPAMAKTILSLNATGTAQTVPDEAVATFEAQATAPGAGDAQNTVNQQVAKALAAIHAISSVTATTSGYNTYAIMPDHQTSPEFTTTQNLTLMQPAAGGVPNAAFNNLLAKLQSEGLLLTGLRGDLSIAGRQHLQREAMRDALAQLHEDAKTIADSLHMKIGALQALNVDANSDFASPVGPRVMALPAAAPPQSAPEAVSITARVNAKIDLEPAS